MYHQWVYITLEYGHNYLVWSQFSWLLYNWTSNMDICGKQTNHVPFVRNAYYENGLEALDKYKGL